MDDEQNKLDPRIIRTRNALRQALIELIPLKGYRNLTVKEIAHQAGLNRSTFYLHFQNKDDLLTSGFEGVWDKLVLTLPLGALEEKGGPDPNTRAVLAANFQGMEEIRPYFQDLLGRNGAPLLQQRLRDMVQSRLRGLMSAAPSPLIGEELARQAALAFLSAAYLGLLEWWLDQEAPCSAARMAELFILLFSMRPWDMIGFDLYLEGESGVMSHQKGGNHDRVV